MTEANKIFIAIVLFITIFITGIVGALFASSYFYEHLMNDYVKHWGLVNWSKGEYSQNQLYSMHALTLKEFAENKDHEAILQRTCWLLLVSMPKINPEVWKDTPREKEDIDHYKQAEIALNELKQKGHCDAYITEE